jgi:hypothetical protein
MIRTFVISLVLLTVVGCGSDSKSDSNESGAKPAPTPTERPKVGTKEKPYSLAATTSDNLPDCATGLEGALAYTTVDKRFLTCTGGRWTNIEVKGAKGDKGEAGEKGETGAKGDPGPTGQNIGHKVAYTILCSGPIESTSLYFSYKGVEFANGDVWASAKISDGYDGIQESVYFAATQNGAVTAPVQVQADRLGTANAGYWRFELPRDTLVLALVYSDADASGGSDSWSMPVSACQKSSY